MKVIFIGTVIFSKHILLKLISLKANIVGVYTLEKSSFNSDYFDLTIICKKHNLDCNYIKNVNDEKTQRDISELKPDVIFCIGFSQLIKSNILEIPPYGVIGYHPSLLPLNRGRHPIIWAIILGLKKTGSTFFFMDEGADSGDILSQKEVEIENSDNAMSLYNKIVKIAAKQVENFFPKLVSNSYSRIKQNDSLANYWRKRSVNDGVIDWRMSANTIYNLVRGLSKPYVGAQFLYRNQIIKVWDCEVINIKKDYIEPGKVIKSDKNQIIIKAGKKAIYLKAIEPNISISEGTYL